MLLGLGASVLWLAVSAESDERPPAARGSGRVVVVPVNLAVRAAQEVEPGLDPVWHALLQYFASEGKSVVAIDRNDAGALWNEVMAEEAKSESGNPDLYGAYARFAKRVGEQAEFDSIVFPTIVTHSARINGRVASWDGVRRQVDIPGLLNESIDTYREGKIWIDRHGATGELAAASLHVAVLSPQGELRYQGTGGLVLLQELAEPKKRDEDVELTAVMRKDAFAAPDQLREGIGAAFRDWPSATASIAN
jgi:hypothetical protein